LSTVDNVAGSPDSRACDKIAVKDGRRTGTGPSAEKRLFAGCGAAGRKPCEKCRRKDGFGTEHGASSVWSVRLLTLDVGTIATAFKDTAECREECAKDRRIS
jgi:hypothetical protein